MHKQRSQTPREDDGLCDRSVSCSSSAGGDEDQQHKQRYSEVSDGYPRPNKTPSTHRSTDNMTWSTSEPRQASIIEHTISSEPGIDRHKREWPERKEQPITVKASQPKPKVRSSQDRHRGGESKRYYEAKPRELPPPPSPIPHRRGKENIRPEGPYGHRHVYREERPLPADPYAQLGETYASNGWDYRHPIHEDPRSNGWLPMQTGIRPPIVGYDYGASQSRPGGHDFDNETELRILEPGCYPHSAASGLGPAIQRPYSSFGNVGGHAAPRHYIDGPLPVQTGYGYGPIEPGYPPRGLPVGPSSYPLWSTENDPALNYTLEPGEGLLPTSHPTWPVGSHHKQLKRRKREDYVERLEQETLGAVESMPADQTGLGFQDQDREQPMDVAVQTQEPIMPRTEVNDVLRRQSFLGQRREQGAAATDRITLPPPLPPGLLTPTHGFTLLTPPAVPESQVYRQPQEDGGGLSTIWERPNES